MAPLVSLVWSLVSLLLHISYLCRTVLAFSNDRSDNLAVYWGQDSAGHQQRLSFYCDDDTVDVIPLAFLYIFRGKGGLPVLDFSNICGLGSRQKFPGSDLTDCSFLEADIRKCQTKGKLVTLSLGGATSEVGFSSDEQAEAFGQLLWDLFLGGKGSIRPLGNVALDGVDLDIEKGSSAHYAAMVNKIRSLAKGASKRYYVTAAPQCPFPDVFLGNALNNAFFDAVYVQFYNNYCGTSMPSDFNFDTWDKWAKTQSFNSNIKVYLGAPGSSKAAGNGYVDIQTLSRIAKDAQRRYSSFGGVMLWDMDVAYTNNRYERAIKNALTGGIPKPDPSPESPNPDPTKTTPESTPDSGTVHTEPTAPSIPELRIPDDFKDPRKTARVKRPSFTLDLRNEAVGVAPTERARLSRFFRL